jgi:hypothetical protein
MTKLPPMAPGLFPAVALIQFPPIWAPICWCVICSKNSALIARRSKPISKWQGPGAADLLFQVVDQRYHQGKPILFTTNKPLRQWGRVLHDEELARAIIDRTLHCGEYLKLSGASYRLKGRKFDLDPPTPAKEEIIPPETSEIQKTELTT